MDFLTGLSIFSNISGLYNLYSGIRYGNIPQKILDEIVQTKGIVEKLSEHLYYAESIEEVKDITKTPHTKLTDKRSVRELLTPFQESLGEDLLSTAVISTPEKLRQAYKKDPWEVLFSIRPLDRVKKPENPDAIPIIFYHNGIHYVGWQMKGTLPILFNFNYDSDKGMYLFSSTKERKERILYDSKQSNDPERIREKRKEKYPKSKPEIIESQPINYSKIFLFFGQLGILLTISFFIYYLYPNKNVEKTPNAKQNFSNNSPIINQKEKGIGEPIDKLFKAWELLDIDLYMAQWSRDALQISNKYNINRNYDDIRKKRTHDFSRFKKVVITKYEMKIQKYNDRSATVFVTYSMQFTRLDGRTTSENQIKERYLLRFSSTLNRWLIKENYDYIYENP